MNLTRKCEVDIRVGKYEVEAMRLGFIIPGYDCDAPATYKRRQVTTLRATPCSSTTRAPEASVQRSKWRPR